METQLVTIRVRLKAGKLETRSYIDIYTYFTNGHIYGFKHWQIDKQTSVKIETDTNIYRKKKITRLNWSMDWMWNFEGFHGWVGKEGLLKGIISSLGK